MKAKFFRSALELRAWFARHHDAADELIVGYYKKSSGKGGLTWSESVDEALSFGWIDGIRHRLDDDRYTNRFTPRRPGSVWSAINIKRVEQLKAEGRMRPAGLAAFERRKENKSGIYSYEQRPQTLPEPYLSRFKKNNKAWTLFEGQPAWRRKALTWWVISAKKEETRQKRLAALIADCAEGRMPSPMSAPAMKGRHLR